MHIAAISFCLSILLFFICHFEKTYADTNLKDEISYDMTFDNFGIPHIKIGLLGEVVDVIIDTGSSLALHIPEKMIDRMGDALLIGEYNSVDGRGEVVKNKEYYLGEMIIDRMKFEKLTITPLIKWGYTLSDSDVDESGPVLGLGFMINKIVTIDYKNKKITFSNDRRKLPPVRWSKKYSFSLQDEGIVFDVLVGGEKRKMIFDTGATLSLYWGGTSNENFVSCLNIHPEMDNLSCKAIRFGFLNEADANVYFHGVFVDNGFKEITTADGIIGNNVFREGKVIFDFIDGEMYLIK